MSESLSSWLKEMREIRERARAKAKRQVAALKLRNGESLTPATVLYYPSDLETMSRIARQRGVTRSDLIRQAVEEFIDRNRQEARDE